MADPPRPAKPHVPDVARMPGELFERPQSVVWRYRLRGGKWTKVPYQPRRPDTPARADVPETWGSLEEAVAAYRSGGFDGIGLEFARDDEFFGVDLDDCLEDGVVAEWARPYVDALEGTYGEISPSGKGLKFIGRGKLPGDRGGRKGGLGPDGSGAVEIYDHGRYFTLTGDAWGDASAIADKQAAAEAIHAVVRPPRPEKAAKAASPRPPIPTDGEADAHDDLDVLARASRKAKFRRLYGGDPCDYPSTSEADLALMNHLAYLCGPGALGQVIRLFQGSKLGRRAGKPDRPDYLERTAARAYEDRTRYAAWADGPNGQPEHPADLTRNGEAAPPAGPPRPARDYLGGRGDRAYSCVSNSRTWLRTHKPNGFVRYDTFRQSFIVGGRPLTDAIVTDLSLEIEDMLGTPWSQEHLRSALVHLGHRDEFSSVVEWLDSLAYDGEEHIEKFFSDHYGCRDTPYTREVGRTFFLGAVARAYGPGCQVDTMPVLIGPQGIGKSRGLAALCPVPEWYADDIGGELSGGKSGEGLRGKWIIEFAEFARLNRSTNEVVKSFLTRSSDHYRPPYARECQDFPRSCVFYATTNNETPLQDTENRRYLPIRVGEANLTGIREGRDQLWAEAVSRYKAGETWWTRSDQMGPLGEEKSDHLEEARAEDAWEAILAEGLLGIERTTMAQAARLLGIRTENLGRSEQTRIGTSLIALGFVMKKGPRPQRERFYERSDLRPKTTGRTEVGPGRTTLDS